MIKAMILLLGAITIAISLTLSVVAGALDGGSWYGTEKQCFNATAPIKEYNPVYLGSCWLFMRKEYRK